MAITVVSPVLQLAPALALIQDPNGIDAPVSGGVFITPGTLPYGFGTGREPAMIGAYELGAGVQNAGPLLLNAGGLRIGLGEPGGGPGGEGLSPFIDLAVSSDAQSVPSGTVVMGGVGTLIVDGLVLPTGASLLEAGDLIIGTAAETITITELAAPVVSVGKTTVSVNASALPSGADLYVLTIAAVTFMSGAGVDAVQVLSVEGDPPGPGGAPIYGQPAAGSAINGQITPTHPGNVLGLATLDCWTIPADSLACTVTFSAQCTSVIRAYAISGVLSVGAQGYDQPEEAAAFDGAISTAATDAFLSGYFPGGNLPNTSLQAVVLSTIAYRSGAITIGALNGNFTNDATEVVAGAMTEQSGHAIVTRGGAGPGDYVGTLSSAHGWVAMSVVFTGKAGGAARLSPSNGVLQSLNGVLSWAAVPAADVTFPLAAAPDMGFQPSGVANSALILHNNASATTGIEITATAGAGALITSYGPAGAVPITITPQGNGPVNIAGTGGLTVTGSIVGPLRDEGGEVYNVMAYGATGNGVTDDSTAIQDVINLASASGAPCSRIHFPPGTYLIAAAGGLTTPIQSTGYLWFTGGGRAVTEWLSAGTNPLLILTMPGGVDELSVNMNGGTGTGISMKVQMQNQQVVVAGAAGGSGSVNATTFTFGSAPAAPIQALLVSGNPIVLQNAANTANGPAYAGTVASYDGNVTVTVNANAQYSTGLNATVASQKVVMGTALTPISEWRVRHVGLSNRASASNSFLVNVNDFTQFYPFAALDVYLEDIVVTNDPCTLQEAVNVAGASRVHVRQIVGNYTGQVGGRGPLNLFAFDYADVQDVMIALGTSASSDTLAIEQNNGGKAICGWNGLVVLDPNNIAKPLLIACVELRATNWHLPSSTGQAFPKLSLASFGPTTTVSFVNCELLSGITWTQALTRSEFSLCKLGPNSATGAPISNNQNPAGDTGPIYLNGCDIEPGGGTIVGNSTTQANTVELHMLGGSVGSYSSILAAHLTLDSGSMIWDVGGIPPSSWTAIAIPVPITTQATGRTLALTDANTIIQSTDAGAISIAVPTHAAVPFVVGTVIGILQYGAGQVTITAAGPPAVDTPSSLTSRAQYSMLWLTNLATDVWVLSGDMT